jgi:curved DNA-binding protein CbpA
MRTYHPDKHTGDAEKQRVATEITQRVTEAFIKIREFRSKSS